ncbi:type II toxin-antitoxin system PemK/MazF family toxin [Brevundimonas sp. R86498]|uniref:type II toxin-antitoxin system PemK/MazF family toxin n=1 Tax=Brevundimonas sp. R86498 TaxID=3093845 RepID=UPI0037CB5213
MIRRGDVWLVRLDPVVGHELRKTRPCVVVSPDDMSHLPVHVIVPMTTGSLPSGYRPEITFAGRVGRLLPDQMRSVDRSRMLRRIGVLQPQDLTGLLATLREMFEE